MTEVPATDVRSAAAAAAAGAFLLDVRQPEEFDEVHATGAVLIPLGEVADRVHEVPGEGPVLVICRSGARSAKATELLRRQGIDASNVAGGTLAWVAAGLPTVGAGGG